MSSAMPPVVTAVSAPSHALRFPATVTVSIVLLFPDTWHQGPLTNFPSALLPSRSLQSHGLQRAPSHTTRLLTPGHWALRCLCGGHLPAGCRGPFPGAVLFLPSQKQLNKACGSFHGCVLKGSAPLSVSLVEPSRKGPVL